MTTIVHLYNVSQKLTVQRRWRGHTLASYQAPPLFSGEEPGTRLVIHIENGSCCFNQVALLATLLAAAKNGRDSWSFVCMLSITRTPTCVQLKEYKQPIWCVGIPSTYMYMCIACASRDMLS